MKSLCNDFLQATLSKKEENNQNILYLPQKFKVFCDKFEQSSQFLETDFAIDVQQILEGRESILVYGQTGSGKTILARRLEELVWKQFLKKQIIPLFISAKDKEEFEITSILRQQLFFLEQEQIEKIQEEISCNKIKAIMIIDDFDYILQENQDFLHKMENSFLNQKCKFIYLVNQSSTTLKTYQEWIAKKLRLLKYEIIKFKKSDIQKYFESFFPWNRFISNIDLSLKGNEIILKQIADKLRATSNIHNILIKIIKLSSIVDDLEQEAGNAMMILKETHSRIIKNQDFAHINLKNSSFDFISFHSCNFEGSQMKNVDISRCWFIQCNLNNVRWLEMKSETQFIMGYQKNVESLVFSNDIHFVAAGFYFSIELWHVRASKRQRLFIKQQSNKNLTFNSTGQILASICSDERKIIIYNCTFGKILRVINNVNHSENLIVFSPNDQLLAYSDRKNIQLQSNKVGKPYIKFVGHANLIFSIKFSPDGRLLATFSYDQIVIIWNIEQKKLKQKLKKIEGRLLTIEFTPDSKYLVGGCDGKIIFWDMSTTKKFDEYKINHSNEVIQFLSNDIVYYFNYYQIQIIYFQILKKELSQFEQD